MNEKNHKKRQIELLAPAKNLESAIAAIDYGADAVYIGGSKFGARYAASNTPEQIAQVVEYAHLYGARVYATINTLLFNNELKQAQSEAQALIDAGVDALIIQDMALRRMGLGAELHASTQANTMTPESAKFLEECGFARIVLERAMSLDQIRQVCQATNAEIECFVHGAICVGYSGRCYLSRSSGGRSGNRGACGQPCRLPYELEDKSGRRILSSRHLLSVQDMNLSNRIEDLIDAGVTSFKVEGRLKEIGYIKNIIAHYRQQIDRVIASRDDVERLSIGESIIDFTPNPSKSFTRGESEYFFDGAQRGVASMNTPKAIGERIGRVKRCERGTFTLDCDHTLTAGDGICLLSEGDFRGTNVNRVEGRVVEPNKIDGIKVGDEVYRNHDKNFNRILERSRTRRVIDISALCSASQDKIVVEYRDIQGHISRIERTVELEPANNTEKSAQTIQTQLSRSGDTIFRVTSVECSGEWFIPSSLLADLRREALDELKKVRQAQKIEHKILPENLDAKYPSDKLTGAEGVTNRLSEAFYRDHGVTEIERGWDLEDSMVGREVMRTAYCIRREIGECLKRPHKLKGDLFIKHAENRYLLKFDCKRCEMILLDQSK